MCVLNIITIAIAHLPRKQFQRGLFSVANLEPFKENILAKSLVTSNLSSVSVLWDSEITIHMQGRARMTSYTCAVLICIKEM